MNPPVWDLTLEISEEDRRAAQRFDDTGHCLLATTARRITGLEANAGTESIRIGNELYMLDRSAGPRVLDAKLRRRKIPLLGRFFYGKKAVGKVFKLRRMVGE